MWVDIKYLILTLEMAHPQGTCVLLEVPTCGLKNYFQPLHTNSDSLFELRGIKIDTDQCCDTDTLTDQPEKQSNIIGNKKVQC